MDYAAFCSDSVAASLKAAEQRAVPLPKHAVKTMMPHERKLLEAGLLTNLTHKGAAAVVLAAPSEVLGPDSGLTLVYRPMGDAEAGFLVANGELPATQPYQAIIEGPQGRAYSAKYLNGLKRTDTHPTTVVEFKAPVAVVQRIREVQCKVEDGAISMGLGDKAGKTLPLFNASLRDGSATFRLVHVKRRFHRR